ncbi:MAG: SprT-like domain-containing protein [Candidatus Acidiferrales bacterium]
MNVQKLFERYNRRYFGGKLRGWTADEVHCSDLPAGRHREYGSCCNETREIFIQIGLSATEKRKTLLHEMCHATACDGCHDESWQKEMSRIAELGARGMALEARSYAARLAAQR